MRGCGYRVSALPLLAAEAANLKPPSRGTRSCRRELPFPGHWPGTYLDDCAALPAIIIFTRLCPLSAWKCIPTWLPGGGWELGCSRAGFPGSCPWRANGEVIGRCGGRRRRWGPWRTPASPLGLPLARGRPLGRRWCGLSCLSPGGGRTPRSWGWELPGCAGALAGTCSLN